MKYTIQIFIAILILVSLYGCSVVAPEVSKAQTELKQLEQLKQQNVYYERICNSLETIAQQQKELTDFANNQREFYKKTHNGY